MTQDEIVAEKKIDGVMTPLTAEDLAEYEADPEAFTAEVIADRKIMEAEGPDTTAEARELVKERQIDEADFDPTDFGDETITTPPKKGEK
jgi:hypothetical protein